MKKIVWKYKFLILSILIFTALTSVLESVGIGMLIPLLDKMTNAGARSDSSFVDFIYSFFLFFHIHLSILNILIAFFTFFAARFTTNFFQESCFFYFRRRLMFDISTTVYNNLMQVAYSFFHTMKKGDIQFAVTGATEQISSFLKSCSNVLSYTFLSFCYFIILCLLSWKLTLYSFLFFIPLLFVYKTLMGISYRFSNQMTKNYMTFNSRFVEFLDGIKIIKAFSEEEWASKIFARDWVNYLRKMLRAHITGSFLSNIQQPLGLLIIIAVILIGTRGYHIPFSSLTVFLLILYKLLPALNNTVRDANQAITFIPPLKVAAAAMSRKNKPYLPDGNKDFKSFEHSISLKNINFSYRPEIPVLKDIQVEFIKKQSTAIVGSAGSGKSTLIDLILRLYDPNQGNVFIDGENIKNIKIKSWRKKIGIVFQETFLFNEAIKENIRFGRPETSDEEIIQAAKISNAHSFIQKLPEGYDTYIGERGIKLSGGQRQMISLARALVRKPEILILDEATSSLDNESERLIQNAIEKISGAMTLIVIAHRLSTITQADKIIVLENGRIVEQGVHQTLLEKKGAYAHYYELQFQTEDR